MYTGYTQDAKRFDEWVAVNYCSIQKYCNKYRIPEDLINDTYLNIKSRILLSGFTNNYFKTYYIRALKNLEINNAKKNKNKHFIDSDNPDFKNLIEEKLCFEDEMNTDTLQYREDVLYLSKKIFEYIMYYKKYDDQHLFVFRAYFLNSGRMTYEKLKKATGINKNNCTRIIQTIKKDIKNNFTQWLKEYERDLERHKRF